MWRKNGIYFRMLRKMHLFPLNNSIHISPDFSSYFLTNDLFLGRGSEKRLTTFSSFIIRMTAADDEDFCVYTHVSAYNKHIEFT